MPKLTSLHASRRDQRLPLARADRGHYRRLFPAAAQFFSPSCASDLRVRALLLQLRARSHASLTRSYRSAHSTVPVEVVRGGKIITRLANSTRHKSKPTTTITFDYHPARGTEPEQGVLPLPLTPKQLKQFTGRGDPDDKDEPFEYSELELKIIGLLEERPIWTRAALFNQLTADERRVATK